MKTFIIKLGKFIKDNFGFVVIAMLITIIMLQNCDRNIELTKPTVIIDTVLVPVKGEIVRLPPIITTIPGETEIQYVPDPSYDKLVTQYNKLVQEHTNKKSYSDTINIDQDGLTGSMIIEDTINKNSITSRKAKYDFNFPKITKTITEPAPKKNQLYYGVGLSGTSKSLDVKAANIGLLLKTKNDQIYNVYGGVAIDGTYTVGVQAYWKIKLGK